MASSADAHPIDGSDRELEALAQIVAATCLRHGATLSTAESCTGGWIAKTLTDLAGSSAWFDCGVVTYSNAAKQSLLGVRAQTIAEHGAVSRQTAIEMAAGALDRFGTTAAVAVTGIAGPTGGTADKPVGTVWIGRQRRGCEAQAQWFRFDGDREAVRRQTVAAALRSAAEILTS